MRTAKDRNEIRRGECRNAAWVYMVTEFWSWKTGSKSRITRRWKSMGHKRDGFIRKTEERAVWERNMNGESDKNEKSNWINGYNYRLRQTSDLEHVNLVLPWKNLLYFTHKHIHLFFRVYDKFALIVLLSFSVQSVPCTTRVFAYGLNTTSRSVKNVKAVEAKDVSLK